MGVIKSDLGPDAVIISSRWVREKGWKGLFGVQKLEVTAAVEEREAIGTPSLSLTKDVAEVKALLKRMTSQIREKPGQNQEESDLLRKWQNILHQLEISHEVTNDLLADMAESTGLCSNEKLIKETVEERLIRIFETSLKTPLEKRVCAFVGPTGVGKTTTLAKLAANLALFEQKKIALLTIDTYRIGAVEQLKTYGEILDVPMEAVLTPQELAQALEKHRDKDYILVDTAGRPLTNTDQLQELQAFLSVLEDPEIFLVLSCTAKNKDLVRIAEAFKLVNYTKLIFTKADETISLGSIVNIVRETSLPVAYITTGQNVPDDIEAGDPEKLVKLVLGTVD